jgi:tetratricopeptide (TPR) repeat protein
MSRHPTHTTASLTASEQVLESCARAKALEARGEFAAAREEIEDRWPRVGVRPVLTGLSPPAAAHLMLRAGSLTGWLGDTRRIAGAQEVARDLLGESGRMFEAAGDVPRMCEALVEQAWCYWREGAFDEARVNLRVALSLLGDRDGALKVGALVRAAIMERRGGRLCGALAFLDEAAELVDALPDDPQLRGRFHGERALVLRNLGRPDEALIEYAAASYYLERAGNLRFRAYVENNRGFLFSTLSRFDEAHAHLDRARQIFLGLREPGSVAQVDETRARVLLAEGRPGEAECVVRRAVAAHEACGEQAFLAQALTTHAAALSRVGRRDQARDEFLRAMAEASGAGDVEGAGRAALSLIEELGDSLPGGELLDAYDEAARLLSRSQHAETLSRLRACADRLPRRDPASSNVVRLFQKSVRGLQTFRVRMSDDSLILAGIRRGDVVQFRRTGEFDDGDLVAAVTPEGRFVVFVRREPRGRLRLEGAHPLCPARYFSHDEINILGVADDEQ